MLAQKLGITGASILYDRYIQVPADAKLKTILESESFAKGEFSMQNPSTYEVVKLLDLKPGLKVWDACAAPGGKSALMAEMDSSLDILASDVSEGRVLKMASMNKPLLLHSVDDSEVSHLRRQYTPRENRILPYPVSGNFKYSILVRLK